MGVVPEAVVTVTWTAPVPPGEVTVIEVGVSVITVAVLGPNFTSLAPPRFVPVIVTDVPPAVDPRLGDMCVIVGGGGVARVLNVCSEPWLVPPAFVAATR